MAEVLPGCHRCFFCGRDKDGPRITVQRDGESVFAEVRIDSRFEGREGVVHGGIVAGLLDELMWWAVVAGARKVCVTRSMAVDFRRPVVCGEPYRIEGRVVAVEGNKVEAAAVIEDAQGSVCAKGKGVYVEVMPLSLDFINGLDFSGASAGLKEEWLAGIQPEAKGEPRQQQR